LRASLDADAPPSLQAYGTQSRTDPATGVSSVLSHRSPAGYVGVAVPDTLVDDANEYGPMLGLLGATAIDATQTTVAGCSNVHDASLASIFQPRKDSE
jgi:hypothetical protein